MPLTPMKVGQTPGYNSGTTNNQALGGLGSPGWQTQFPSLGGNTPPGSTHGISQPSSTVMSSSIPQGGAPQSGTQPPQMGGPNNFNQAQLPALLKMLSSGQNQNI